MANTTPRINNSIPAHGSHARPIEQNYLTPAYASTLAVTTDAQYTLVQPGLLTGAMSITINTTNPLIGDQVEFWFASTAGATVTFSTGFVATATTLVVTSPGVGTILFGFNGTSWIELRRSLVA